MPADDLPRRLNPIDREDRRERPIRVEETDEGKANGDLVRALNRLKLDEPIPDALLPAAREIWRKQGLADQMVADFVAAESGEVFLYVNDAAQVLPLFGPLRLFYKNNSGAAKVTLRRMPLPGAPLPDK